MTFYGLGYQEIRDNNVIHQLILNGLSATDSINDYSVDDILRQIGESKAQCWGWFENGKLLGIVITKIHIYPKQKVLYMFLAAGKKLDTIFEQGWSILLAFGRSKGCKAVRGTGRSGWTRKLKVDGYITWSKEI